MAQKWYSVKIMTERLTIMKAGASGGEAWLVRGEKSAVLVDSGFPFYGGFLAKEIGGLLDGLPLTDILITHSHYDHAGGFAKVKAAFPDAALTAAAHAQQILRRANALDAMRALNRTAAAMRGMAREASDDDVGEYEVDRIAKDGDRITTKDFQIEVWETPGHTNDSLSFWFPREKLMALSESTGIFSKTAKGAEMYVEPAFIVSWKAAAAALNRIEEASPRTLIVPHGGVLTGGDVSEFLRKEAEEILFAKDLIFRFTDEGKTEDDILDAFKTRYYDRRPGSLKECQPLQAFMLNHRAMIPRTLSEGP